MRRLFIALLPPKEIEESIVSWRKTHDLRVRWLSERNLHLTLVPPWEETDPDESIEKLGSVISAPIELSFTSVGFGPDPRSPRLIWATGPTPTELLDLRDSVAKVLGKEIPSRFTTHITLARFRPEIFEDFPVKNLKEKVNWNGVFDSWALMESHLFTDGAEYKPIARFQLK